MGWGIGWAVAAGIVGTAAGEEVRLPVTRDTWVSGVGEEADGSNGGAARLKLKSYQEFSLVDLDPEPLRGRVVERARLHLKREGTERLWRVTVGTVGAEWFEGTGAGYEKQEGASTFKSRRHPAEPWDGGGGDIAAVILGSGGSVWRMADATAPDGEGWQVVEVDPAVIGARVAGIGHGFVLFDDTATEWERKGEEFLRRHNPNRYVASKDSNRASAPFFTVELGAEDREGPGAPGGLKAEAGDLPAGEAWLAWTTPADEGGAGTAGFFVEVGGKELPRYLIPAAGKPGERVRMRLRDLGFAGGGEIGWSVAAVDGAGNVGPRAKGVARISGRVAGGLPGDEPAVGERGWLKEASGAVVAVVDELEVVHPADGPAGPGVGAHLVEGGRVTLRGARNEFFGFQVAVKGEGEVGIEVAMGDGAIGARVGRMAEVETEAGPRFDPVVAVGGGEPLEGSAWRSYLVEVYIPHEARAGMREGRVVVRAGGGEVVVPVGLEVWDFTLPDFLSFLPEMNCYGLPANERDFYRLAHEHRTVLNRVPYSQRGTISDGCAPGWDGEKLDWSAWDERFGPLLDGSAFADLPRKGVPLEVFYLPVHENWPTPMEGNYNGDYWADRAFPEAYREAFVEVTRGMAEHFEAKGWTEPRFHGFLNNKHDFKNNGWSRGSSPWLLDEPASFQDFWALRYYGAAFHEGVRAAGGRARMLYRADISRPEWQRDSLDGLLDYSVTASSLRQYPRIVFDRKEKEGQIVLEYGSANEIGGANAQGAAWCVDAWAIGCDGVVPWQTVGTAGSWEKADRLALLYPAPPWAGEKGGVVPSIRLKAFRRGQQDVEYLTLWSKVSGEPRWAVGEAVRGSLGMRGERSGTGFAGEDAGVITYGDLGPADLWKVRTRVGKALSAARPPAARRLVELATPARDPALLEEREVGK